MYSYFLAYLVDKRKEPRQSGAISNNNWIEYCKSKLNKMNTMLKVIILILTQNSNIYEEKANK